MLRWIACCLATLLPAQDPSAPVPTPDPEAPSPAADSSAAATRPPEPWPIVAPQDQWYDEKRLGEIVAQMQPLAEKHSGLAFLQPPVVRIANDDSWKRLVSEEMPGARDAYLALVTTLALYVPTRGEVVLSPFFAKRLFEHKNSMGREEAQAALVHEMVHILQDQHFRLPTRMRAATHLDAKKVLRCMVEGFATWVEGRAAAELGLPGYARVKAKGHAENGRMDYVRGCDFFARLHESGGFEAMHAAMRNEPLKLHEFVRIALKKPAAAAAASPPSPKPEGPPK